jgi:hypothetical protein
LSNSVDLTKTGAAAYALRKAIAESIAAVPSSVTIVKVSYVAIFSVKVSL